MPAQMPPEMSFSSSGSCALALMPSALKPIAERLAERDDAADERQPQQAVLLEHRGQRMGDDLDLAERDLVGLEPALLELLGQRLADGDRPRGDAAHHHALEDGLAADGGVALRDELAGERAVADGDGLTIARRCWANRQTHRPRRLLLRRRRSAVRPASR